MDAAGTSSGLFPTAVTRQLPADIRNLRAPRTTDRYCYAVNTTRVGYTVAVVGMEDQENADSDTNPTAVNGGVGIIVSTGAACTIDCSASRTYCLGGTTAN